MGAISDDLQFWKAAKRNFYAKLGDSYYNSLPWQAFQDVLRDVVNNAMLKETGGTLIMPSGQTARNRWGQPFDIVDDMSYASFIRRRSGDGSMLWQIEEFEDRKKQGVLDVARGKRW